MKRRFSSTENGNTSAHLRSKRRAVSNPEQDDTFIMKSRIEFHRRLIKVFVVVNIVLHMMVLYLTFRAVRNDTKLATELRGEQMYNAAPSYTNTTTTAIAMIQFAGRSFVMVLAVILLAIYV